MLHVTTARPCLWHCHPETWQQPTAGGLLGGADRVGGPQWGPRRIPLHLPVLPHSHHGTPIWTRVVAVLAGVVAFLYEKRGGICWALLNALLVLAAFCTSVAAITLRISLHSMLLSMWVLLLLASLALSTYGKGSSQRTEQPRRSFWKQVWPSLASPEHLCCAPTILSVPSLDAWKRSQKRKDALPWLVPRPMPYPAASAARLHPGSQQHELVVLTLIPFVPSPEVT